MMLRLRSLLMASALGAVAIASPAHAQSDEKLTVRLLQLMVDEGLLPAEKAQSLLDAARAEAAAEAEREKAAANAVDVPYVPEVVREKIREEVKAEVIAKAKEERWIAERPIPRWVDAIDISGDFRLRRREIYFGQDNFGGFPDLQAINDAGGILTAEGAPTINTTNNFGQSLYRARIGIEAAIANGVTVGVRLGSGEDNGPVSTNELIDDYFAKGGLWIDQAYVELKPFEQLTLIGGRMARPFYSTDLVWDEDLNFEGVAAKVRLPLGEGLAVIANGGAFPLEQRYTNEVSLNRWLYGGQLGAEFATGDVELKAAVAYYDFQNIRGRKNELNSRLNDYTALTLVGSGNSKFNIRNDGELTQLVGLSSDFDVLNVTGSIAYRGFDDIVVRLTGDFAKNLAFDRADILALAPNSTPPGDIAWQARLDVGRPAIERLGHWRIGLAYRRLETDSVLDVFTDSDFGLGGTDLKGYVLDAELGIFRNTSIGARWLSANAIERRALSPLFAVDTLLLDLNARF